MADVLLDLWGVLTDSHKMTPAYRRRMAEILRARHGGTIDKWLEAHDAAYAWYSEAAEDPATWDGSPWLEVVDRLDADHVRKAFRVAGVPPPAGDVLAYARALEVDVMSGVDSKFPDARPALERLKRAGHRLYLATAATDTSARATLQGAGLLSHFDGVFTGTSQNARKWEPRYWRGTLERMGSGPRTAFLVDDRLDYLKAASDAGLRCVLIDRQNRHPPAAVPGFIEATMGSLAGLPEYVDDAVGRASDSRKVL